MTNTIMQNQIEPATRLRGRTLTFARLTWGALVLTILIAFSLVTLVSFSAPIMICDSGCTMTPAQAAAWTGAGLSPASATLFTGIVFNLFMALGFVVIAALIAWRKSDDWMALLVSFSLVGLGLYLLSGVNLALSARPGWQLLTLILLPLTSVAFTVLFYIFPDGRFIPRWTRWLFLGYALLWIGASVWDLRDMLAGTYRLNTPGDIATIAATLVLFCGGIAAQVYRYARVSDPAQRQQTKWVVFGLVGPTLTLLIWFTLAAPLQNSVAASVFAAPIMTLLALAWPVSMGLAILRYRLWDIDIIIRQTLIYSVLTALLALVYFGSVIVLQQLSRAFIGAQQSEIAVILSTLAIAALFNPLRHRIQDSIDLRFYRRKYNAAHVLAAFGATMRDEVELEKLTDHLLAVVDETMKPSQVNLWLKRTERGEK